MWDCWRGNFAALTLRFVKLHLPPPGDEDFLAESLIVFQNQDGPSALAGFDGTHQTSRTTTDYYDIENLQRFDSL